MFGFMSQKELYRKLQNTKNWSEASELLDKRAKSTEKLAGVFGIAGTLLLTFFGYTYCKLSGYHQAMSNTAKYINEIDERDKTEETENIDKTE